MLDKVQKAISHEDFSKLSKHQRKMMLSLGVIPGHRSGLCVKKLGMTHVTIATSGLKEWLFVNN